MRRSLTLLCLIALLAAVPAGARSKKNKGTTTPVNQPGKFDYYLLTLSWSPEYCTTPAGSHDGFQCAGKKFGFVVHGLWPQYEKGYPQSCATPSKVPDNLIQSMLPLMPSGKLIQHEWEKHGTCSGLTVDGYMQEIQKAFSSVSIPDDFKSPLQNIEMQPDAIKQKFLTSNPSLNAGGVHVQCSGKFLSEVRFCLTRDLKSRQCSAEIRDTCTASPVIVRPVR